MGQQFVAQLLEIVMPADFSRDCSGVTEVRRVHQLEILFILCSSPSGDLIDPFAEMAMIGAGLAGPETLPPAPVPRRLAAPDERGRVRP